MFGRLRARWTKVSKKYLSGKKGKNSRHRPTSRKLGVDEHNLSVIERRRRSVERSILVRASLKKCPKLGGLVYGVLN
jgi:hypothetical protein